MCRRELTRVNGAHRQYLFVFFRSNETGKVWELKYYRTFRRLNYAIYNRFRHFTRCEIFSFFTAVNTMSTRRLGPMANIKQIYSVLCIENCTKKIPYLKKKKKKNVQRAFERFSSGFGFVLASRTC